MLAVQLSIAYLGVIIDNELQWTAHIDHRLLSPTQICWNILQVKK